MTDKEVEQQLKGTFLQEHSFDIIINEDADGYTLQGQLLFRFRKNVIPADVLNAGQLAFRDSITLTEGRGTAAGQVFKRKRVDGSITNTTVSNYVESGNVGYMDQNAMIHFCRKTAFTSKYFEVFKQGVPFVKCVDNFYKELCPEYYAKQRKIALGTNRNYVIEDTSFTTVTVNRNFQTAVHKDSGDFQRGFGNLAVYREGDWKGSYFCLPEFRVAVDMQNGDLLFVDVHRWHGNTPFIDFDPAPTPLTSRSKHPQKNIYPFTGADVRIAFVMYYREYMIQCKQPKQELHDVQMETGGFLKL